MSHEFSAVPPPPQLDGQPQTAYPSIEFPSTLRTIGGILQGAEKCPRAHPGEETTGHTRRGHWYNVTRRNYPS